METEVDVIVELKDEPLARIKEPQGRAARARQQKQVREAVMADVLRLDQETRREKGLALSATWKHQYGLVLNGFAIRIRQETLEKLKKHPQVKKVSRDEKVEAFLSQSVPLIKADQVWNTLAKTGKGIIVAIVDTGIDYTHPDLGGCIGPTCKVIGGYDFINNDANPMDDHGHGTHVAGIVAANGTVKGG
jgi:subtilisin family serine protease